jgi:hypothetical protein
MLYEWLEYRPFSQDRVHLIEGIDLLFLLQRCVNLAARQPASGQGTQAEPWRPKSASEWLDCAGKAKGVGEAWLAAGGRMLKMDGRLYFSDQGPAWRYKTGTGMQTPNEVKAYGGQAPTYRLAAQTVVRPRQVFPEADQRRMDALEDAVDNDARHQLFAPKSWKDVSKQPMLVRTIRNLLQGEKLSLMEDGKFNRDYSRLQQSMPVLTAAMFLAEPARNSRAFPINLMLLDLAERGMHTLDQILWHPQALFVDMADREKPDWIGNRPVKGTVYGPPGNEADQREVTPLQTLGKLHRVGGVMPASPTLGGTIGARSPEIEVNPHNPRPAFAVDYIHQKEISVLLQWLEMRWPAVWRARHTLGGTEAREAIEITYGQVMFPDPHAKQQRLRMDLKQLGLTIRHRAETLSAIS